MEEHAEAIAVVGIGCRFPGGADSPAAYWAMLTAGRDAIVPVPEDRWDVRRFYDPDPSKPGKMYVRHGGFLREPIDRFDTLFFGISPREAAKMDPQQRLLLEVAWEALEDAGIPADGLAGSDTGVYIGGFMLDNMISQLSPLNRHQISAQTAISSTMCILSNRISYLLDLRGPSLTLDTACSSSLVAIHQACESLRRGECTLALAGGVNVMARPENPISMCKGGFLAKDGRCKSFDARGDGYGRGEGAGVVVLKPLAQALADGDPIYALVRGTGANQDGRTDGITVPNPDAQATLIHRVCERAGVSPRRIRYFEAHGTGTAVGDPLEARALGAAVGKDRGEGELCPVGSVKANIGHLEAAAGVAGFIKAALCLQHKQVPPLANLQTPNPNIPFAELGLRLPLALEPMPEGEGPAIVGVNSFGYGGTNAHAILEEAPPACARASAPANAEARAWLLPISARSEAALVALAKAYRERLTGPDAPPLADVCYTASVRRSHHDYRCAAVGADKAGVVAQLDLLTGEAGSRQAMAKAGDAAEVQPVFVFNGMGPQWWAMGRELMRDEPVVREVVEHCDEIFRGIAGWSIRDALLADEADSRMPDTRVAQPANFVIQVALAALWRSWGVTPAAVVGHSVGEVAAAYVAGALSLEDALRVSYHRSRIQKKAAGLGGMLAAGLAQPAAEALLAEFGGSVCIAAANGPSSVTLAGETQALQAIAARLEAEGVFNRFLQVEIAYHSPYMDPLLDEVSESLARLAPRAPGVPLYSTVTGQRVDGATHDAAYWCRNVRDAVLFAKAMDTLIGDGHRTFLEVGPHPVLSTSIRECLSHRGVRGSTFASLRREQPERATLLQAVGGLYAAGYAFDWTKLHPAGGRCVRLPAYPWQRESYGDESEAAARDRLGDPSAHALLADRVASPQPCWETGLNTQALPYLPDHGVDGLVVLPGAAYVEAGLAVHAQAYGRKDCALHDLRFHQALVVEPDQEPLLRVEHDPVRGAYAVYSRAGEEGGAWTLHATGRLSPGRLDRPAPLPLAEIRARCAEQIDAAAHYREMEARGLRYGPWFQGVRALGRGDGEVLAEIAAHDGLDDATARLHPTLLDACFQSLLAIVPGEERTLYLPVAIAAVRMHAPVRGSFCSWGRITRRDGDGIEGDLVLADADGKVLAEVRGLRCQRLSRPGAAESLDDWTYAYAWEPAEAPGPARDGGTWIVFGDRGGVGERLAAQLQTAGRVVLVHAGDRFDQPGAQAFRIRRHCPEDLRRVLDQVGECRGVTWLWGLDAPAEAHDPVGTGDTVAALQLVQALAAAGAAQPPRLYVVTCGAQQVHAGEAADALAEAPLVGLARVAFSEHPELRCTLIDLDPDTPDVALLAAELLSDTGDDDIAFRAGERFRHGLAHTRLELPSRRLAAGDGHAFELLSDGFREVCRHSPGPDEIELSIDAVVLTDTDGRALGGRGRSGQPLHDAARQVAGTVTRVGSRVTHYAAGQALIACMPAGIATHVTVPAAAVLAIPQPAGLDSARGAALLLPFAAAAYALRDVARLQADETLLVHGGADVAVAMQLAGRIGARVMVATSAEEAARLGLDQWIDVEAADFADRVLASTGGCGVDAMLDLRGTLAESARILAPFGRCVRFGGSGEAPVAVPGRNQSFTELDLRQLVAQRPARLRELLGELSAALEAGDFAVPTVPVVAAADLDDAIAALAQPGGAVALALGGEPVEVRSAPSATVHPDAGYLITGGFGGFGLKLAEWLIAQGARHLALVGRRGAATPEARAAVAALQARGAQVLCLSADIGAESDVRRLLAETAAVLPPLRGILHTAAVLDDAPLAELDAARFAAVMAPKALGAWHLHRLTQGCELDFFVLFSSVSALIGNARQGNYVAANCFLDALATHRRSQGLAATSIHWGVLGEVGMAAGDAARARHLEQMGMHALAPAQAMAALGRVLECRPAQVGVFDVDWEAWSRFDPVTAASPRFARLAVRSAAGGTGSATDALWRELAEQEPQAAQERLAVLLAEQVAATLRLPVDRVDLQQSLTQMGMDSLMSIELQVGLRSALGVEISPLELIKAPSLAQLAAKLLARHGTGAAPPGAPPAAPAAAEPVQVRDTALAEAIARIDTLSDDEVDTLLQSMNLQDPAEEAAQ